MLYHIISYLSLNFDQFNSTSFQSIIRRRSVNSSPIIITSTLYLSINQSSYHTLQICSFACHHKIHLFSQFWTILFQSYFPVILVSGCGKKAHRVKKEIVGLNCLERVLKERSCCR